MNSINIEMMNQFINFNNKCSFQFLNKTICKLVMTMETLKGDFLMGYLAI